MLLSLFRLRKLGTVLVNNKHILIFVTILSIFFWLISYFHIRLINLNSVQQDESFGVKFTSSDSELSELESLEHLSRITSYCNAPHKIKVENELLPDDVVREHELELTSTVVAIRHGDRGPLRTLRHMDRLDCTIRNYFENEENKQRLSNISDKFVEKRYEQLFLRYLNAYNLDKIIQPPRGYRIIPEEVVINGYIHSKNQWTVTQNYTSAVITAIGALQHLILGTKLADVYREKLDIDKVSAHKLMKVYSTTYQRTFQSAFAFLYGFLDPMTSLEYNHFPNIYTTKGHLFCGFPQFCGKCDKLNYLFRSFEETRTKLLSSNKHTVDVVFKLKALISPSNKSSTFTSFEALYDGVLTYLCHGSKVPCDEFNGCATTAEINHLISSLEDHYKSILNTKMYKKMNLMKTFGFYQQLIDHFESLIKEENSFKFVLFSGHDVTLIPISSVLDIYDGIIPPFASRLVFETYKSVYGNHYLRIVYNGKDLTKLAEICNSSKQCVHLQDSTGTFHSLILLDSFHHFIQEKLKELTNSDTFENACSYSI